MKKNLLLTTLFGLSVSGMAQAAYFEINPTNSAHCIYSASVCFGDMNRGAYVLDGGASGVRHFMLFDLSGLSGTLLSARLEIDAGQHAYSTFSTSQPYVVTGLSVDRALITTRTTGPAARLVYDAIGAGQTYGSTSVDTPINNRTFQPMPFVSVDLVSGLHDIDSALGGEIALGGYTFGGVLFSPSLPGNGAAGTRLVLEIAPHTDSTVPSPPTLPLVATLLAVMTLVLRGQRPVGKRS